MGKEKVILKRLRIEWIHLWLRYIYIWEWTESRWIVAREWERGEPLLEGTALWRSDASVLKLNSHDECAALWTYQKPLSHTLGVWILWYVVISGLLVIKDKSTFTVGTWFHLTPEHSSVHVFPRRWQPPFFRLSRAVSGTQGCFSPHHHALLVRCSPIVGRSDLDWHTRLLEDQRARPMMWLDEPLPPITCQSWVRPWGPGAKDPGDSWWSPTKHTPYQICLVREKSGRISDL